MKDDFTNFKITLIASQHVTIVSRPDLVLQVQQYGGLGTRLLPSPSPERSGDPSV